MKLNELMDIVNENSDLEVLNNDTGEIMAIYDGRDSIPSYLNDLPVVMLETANYNNGKLSVYVNAGSIREGYVRLNDESIPIEKVEDEHEAENDFKPSFWWNNRRYFIENFIRTHDNPWVGGNWPEFIHAYESEEYYHPLFIELIGDSAVNIWEELKDGEN